MPPSDQVEAPAEPLIVTNDESFSWVINISIPTWIPEELDTVMLVDPFVRPAVIDTEVDIYGVGLEPKVMAAVAEPLQFRVVELEEALVPPTETGPAPLRVTLDGIVKLLSIRNVPALSDTTSPAGQELSAA
jgi:hypothetical protein